MALATCCSMSTAAAATDSLTGATGVVELSFSSLVSIIAIAVPTCATSFTSAMIFTSVPFTGDGTSLSTLSVATSTTLSSASMASPTFFNQVVIVASATDSPILGRINSN